MPGIRVCTVRAASRANSQALALPAVLGARRPAHQLSHPLVGLARRDSRQEPGATRDTTQLAGHVFRADLLVVDRKEQTLIFVTADYDRTPADIDHAGIQADVLLPS